MSEAPRSAAPASTTAGGGEEDFDVAMRAELDRRIAALGSVDEGAFGAIGRGEWALTVLLTIVLPLVLVWVFR